MITKEVREWMQKVERGQYSYEDALYVFTSFMPILTKDEIKTIKSRLSHTYTDKPFSGRN